MKLTLIRVRAAVAALLLPLSLNLSATLLTPGDLQFVAYQADNPDRFSFVLWQPIAAETDIWFTDSGWLNTGEFRGNEGLIGWHSLTALSSGTVINVDLANNLSSHGSITPDQNIRLASSGDQLFAFQGSWESPEFIAGLQMEGDSWQSQSTSASTSALPAELDSALAQLHFSSEWDNAIYQGPTSDLNKRDLQQSIASPANWLLSNSQLTLSIPAMFQPIELNSTDSAQTIELANGASSWFWLVGLLVLFLVCRSSQKTRKSSQLMNKVKQRGSDQLPTQAYQAMFSTVS